VSPTPGQLGAAKTLVVATTTQSTAFRRAATGDGIRNNQKRLSIRAAVGPSLPSCGAAGWGVDLASGWGRTMTRGRSGQCPMVASTSCSNGGPGGGLSARR
jgi:predicted flavoprotein YhiN